MKHAERAAKTLDALRELETAITIDDFGTGYQQCAAENARLLSDEPASYLRLVAGIFT